MDRTRTARLTAPILRHFLDAVPLAARRLLPAFAAALLAPLAGCDDGVRWRTTGHQADAPDDVDCRAPGGRP